MGSATDHTGLLRLISFADVEGRRREHLDASPRGLPSTNVGCFPLPSSSVLGLCRSDVAVRQPEEVILAIHVPCTVAEAHGKGTCSREATGEC